MEKFKFTPITGFQDSNSYPEPSNETEVREQLQRPLNQLRDYINDELTESVATDIVEIRSDISDVSTEMTKKFNDITGISKNIFVNSNFKRGYSLSNTDGKTEQFVPQAGYTLDYIPLEAEEYSLSSKVEGTNVRAFYYDGDKKFISTSVLTTDTSIHPTLAKFVRLQSTLDVYDNNDVQFEAGKKTEYAPQFTANDTYIRKQVELLDIENLIYLANHNGRVLTIAPYDASEYDMKTSDIVCDGVNDVDIINHAIESLVTIGGGKIILKKGRFLLNKIYKNNRCIECNVGNKVIEIESEIANFNRNQSEGQEANTGAQFYMTNDFYESLSDTDGYSAISIVGNSLDGGIILKNFGIVIPHNQKKIVGLDMLHFNGMCRCEGLYINAYNRTYEPNVSVGQAPSVANEGSIGLRTICATSIGAIGSQYSNCIIKGFYEGIAVNSEHIILNECATVFCVYGYTFHHYGSGNNQHPNLLVRCMDERNVNLPKFYNHDQKQPVIIIGMNLERKPNNTPGGVVGDFATEETQGQWFGEITYSGTTTVNDNGYTNSVKLPFWKDGHGHNVMTRNLAHSFICDTDTRKSYKASFGEKIYDTTLNKSLICINETSQIWVDSNGLQVDPQNLVTEIIVDKVPSSTDGKIVDSSGRQCTNYIEVDTNKTYNVSFVNPTVQQSNSYIFCYDSNKQYLGYKLYTNNTQYNVSAEFTSYPSTKYIVVRMEHYFTDVEVKEL